MSVWIVEEQKLRTQRTVLDNALIQGIVFVGVCLGAFDRGYEFSGGVPGESGSTIAQRITGSVVGIVLRNRPGHVCQAVAGSGDGIGIKRAAELRLGTVAVGVIPPQLEAAVVRLADQAVERVVIVAAVVQRIGISCLRDAASRIVGQRTRVVANRMGVLSRPSKSKLRVYA